MAERLAKTPYGDLVISTRPKNPNPKGSEAVIGVSLVIFGTFRCPNTGAAIPCVVLPTRPDNVYAPVYTHVLDSRVSPVETLIKHVSETYKISLTEEDLCYCGWSNGIEVYSINIDCLPAEDRPDVPRFRYVSCTSILDLTNGDIYMIKTWRIAHVMSYEYEWNQLLCLDATAIDWIKLASH